MTSSKLINYTTREFMSDHELEQYITKQNEIFTPKVVEEFTKAVGTIVGKWPQEKNFR